MEETIRRVVRCLKKFYDVIPYEDLYQEAWVWSLENYKKTSKFEESLFNHLKYIIRKEIKRRKMEVPLTFEDFDLSDEQYH